MRKWQAVTIGALAGVIILCTAAAVLLSSFIKGEVPSVLVEQRALYSRQSPPGGTVYKDVPYSRKLFNRQELDIYMPHEPADGGSPAQNKSPAVVFVHGGSWMHGSKEDIRIISRFVESMRQRGWAVISINYVCPPLRLLKGPSRNVSRAFEWIHQHAPHYGIDPWNMGVYSASAGSHLTMEAMIASGDPGSLWRFWLDEYGPVDLLAMAEGDAFDASGKLSRFPKRFLRKHSPLLHINGAFPPTMIIHGDADRTVALDQSERLARALSANGTVVKMIVIPGGNHGFFNKSQAEWEDMETQALAFMERFFRK